jgi:hypothetical protein
MKRIIFGAAFAALAAPTAALAQEQCGEVTITQMNWDIAHLRQRPSYRPTKGQSCTNFQSGPLKWGCPLPSPTTNLDSVAQPVRRCA